MNWRSAYLRDRDGDGVPATALVTGPDELMVSVPYFDRGAFWEPLSPELVLPVRYGRPRVSGSSSGPFGSVGYQTSGGSCSEDIVNLLVISKETPEGEPAFKNRVYLPRYFFFKSDTEMLLAVLVVGKDTNLDGKLDCGDEAKFQTISLKSGEIKSANRMFIADNTTQIRYDDSTKAFTFYEAAYTNDNLSLKSVQVFLEDLSVSEAIAPDLISKSRDAFNSLDVN